MPLAITCMRDNLELTIQEALDLRDATPVKRRKELGFRCADCGEAVKAFKEGTTGGEAHFEHYARNSACQLSDPAR